MSHSCFQEAEEIAKLNLMLFNTQHLESFKQMQKNIGKAFICFFIALVSSPPLVAIAEQVTPFALKNDSDGIRIESDTQSTDSIGGVFNAFGNVKIIYSKKGIVASSRQAQYLKNEGIIVLLGDVDLIREGQNSIHGARVVYFLEEDRFVVDSDLGSQVLLKLFLDPNEQYEESPSL